MQVARPLVALLAAALVPLAACSDDEPTSHPTPSPSMSSSSPTESESPDPQPESAEAFIRRWADATHAMQNAAIPTSFLLSPRRAHRAPTWSHLVVGFYDSGGYVKTDGWTVETIARVPVRHRADPVYLDGSEIGANPLPRRRLRPGEVPEWWRDPATASLWSRNMDSWLVINYIAGRA